MLTFLPLYNKHFIQVYLIDISSSSSTHNHILLNANNLTYNNFGFKTMQALLQAHHTN